MSQKKALEQKSDSGSRRDGSYRIVIADDHAILRAGLRNLISDVANLQVVGEVKDGTALIDMLDERQADLLILDISMPGINGLEVVRELRSSGNSISILILTMHKEPEFFQQALSAGVNGYILKDDVFERLISAINEIRRGRQFFSNQMVSALAHYEAGRDSDEGLALLTEREKEVLELIAMGCRNKDIAEELDISIRTVETHRARLNEKLGINSVAGLVKFAISKGLA